MPSPVEVQLGEHVVSVYPQRHAYLANRLGSFIQRFTQSGTEITSETILSFGQATIYELLSIVIPQLGKRMPEYEFRGYASKEALEADDYDPEADKSPTVPEIQEALETVGRVNRFDVIKHLGKVIDPNLLKGLVSKQVATQILKSSENLPSTNGESAKTTSGTKRRTSKANVA